MRLTAVLVCLGIGFLDGAAAGQECGTPQGECPTAHGVYRLVLPTSPEGATSGPAPAIVYLHGYNGSPAGVMKNAALLATASARGYALIAPQGQPTPDRPERLNWSVRDGRSMARDDIAFLAEVLDDAVSRGIDRQRILMTGFSRGGSMVWDIACHAPRMARAYAPVAGAFWEPMPEECAGPVDLFHTHGWSDSTVPLEGRAVAGGERVQGDAFVSLRVLRKTLDCFPQMPDATPMDVEGNLWFREWANCPGGRIDLMLHPGGHGLPPGWLTRALDWFEARLNEG